ncbi:hypothetical protein ACVIYL_007207 [Bradyrhizobium sp. USDA 3315]
MAPFGTCQAARELSARERLQERAGLTFRAR